MKDSEFLRTKVPMTKQEVRAISIDKLDLQGKSHFLDIGSGTGSVSIQVAKDFPNIQVTAIEHDSDAIDIMKQNIEHFGLTNITLIEGEAPSEIPNVMYDAVFVGGSGKQLSEIVQFSTDHLSEGGSLVMNFILNENAFQGLEIMQNQIGLADVMFTNVVVSNWYHLGPGHYFKPNNPTFVLSGTKIKGE
ncbi:decarboxylating cobalt-precorrin-6B (C(15))-methyltransferase [Furfurilactobacillus siliginis]|uniref:Cobalt-precorrin-6Y C(15)-methyltransferase n=1 Tax=Furfurilactobacillus siliginis TaxID=348151 RepID=A0A0R2LAM2_9LACO|nr:decarboxylating cobalt-precorrin-6B (C(15))-methyltransferase [Furfurilactobacillus siliginis]KRN96186.1 cobalt-precorrin-6Y C(15)-methyltransferase [Furfurilactobacillus siliginis]GEK27889.1 cobalt-precorrin-6Y C(15)-methyltransferase [Furfurilactobacillus siliginis]